MTSAPTFLGLQAHWVCCCAPIPRVGGGCYLQEVHASGFRSPNRQPVPDMWERPRSLLDKFLVSFKNALCS